MIARTYGTCPACQTPIVPAVHEISKRPVGKGGRMVWAHTDCEAAAYATEIADDIANADAYAEHAAVIAAAAARKAAHEADLTARYLTNPAGFLATLEANLATAEAADKAQVRWADWEMASTYARLEAAVADAKADLEFVRSIA